MPVIFFFPEDISMAVTLHSIYIKENYIFLLNSVLVTFLISVCDV